MKHCPRAVSIARPSTLQLTALPSELAAAPGCEKGGCPIWLSGQSFDVVLKVSGYLGLLPWMVEITDG